MNNAILYVMMNKLIKKIDELLGHINVMEKIPTQDPISPCDVCKYNPPSSTDGKPCTMCLAEGREE